MISELTEAQGHKEDGNKHYKAGSYEDAIIAYTKAIKISDNEEKKDKAVFFKNRAACYLKLEKFDLAAKDASSCLELTPADTKALFRLCQALEKMGKIEEAYKESKRLLILDPKNSEVQNFMRRLTAQVTEKVKAQSTTESKVGMMFDALKDTDKYDEEKRLQAANNLIVLAREEAGAQRIFRENGVQRIKNLVQDKDAGLQVAGLRILSCLCTKHKTRASAVLKQFSLPDLGRLFCSESEEVCNAAAGVILSATDAFLGEDEKHLQHTEHAVSINVSDEFKTLLLFFCGLLTNKDVTGVGRDAVIDIIIKYLPKREGVGRGMAFMTNGGLSKLLHVAGQVPQLKKIPITKNTHMHVSVALDKLYEYLWSDKKREYYHELCTKYLSDKFKVNTMESNMEAITALMTILQGPVDAGNKLLNGEGVMEVMVAMVSSNDTLHQKIALEAIICAANKKDKCTGVLQASVDILKDLYQSNDQHIKIRALVALCKMGSYGGSDYSIKAFAEGSTLKLCKEVKRIILAPKADNDMKRWSMEALAYLSLDADVKEDIVNDKKCMEAIIDFAKYVEDSGVYGVLSIFINLTNMYDDRKFDEEMVQLARYAKHHVPEEHPKDSKEYVTSRVKKIVKANAIPSFVLLAKSKSDPCRDLLSRLFLAIVEYPEYRGAVVQAGGGKVLIDLANNGNDLGKISAAQALAKIAVTLNPEIAFPGQRSLEAVRPLIKLLHMDNTAMQNFEALMALTNLASMNNSLRKRIMKEQGFSDIENYMFEEHEHLRRASTECMCNLVVNEDAAEMFLGENDRVKLLVLFCLEEDPKLVTAAAGALAILSSKEEICKKILEVSKWEDMLKGLNVSDNLEFQLRGIVIACNMIDSNKEIATKVIETEMMEILMALSKLNDPKKAAVTERAQYALEKAAEMGLIEANKP